MTQPTTVNETFDTSLIDTHQLLHQSFSSTETDTSGSSTDRRPKPAVMADAQAFTSVTNDQLYDTWASTYDTDGNVLQAVDDLELKTLLPDFVRLCSQASSGKRRASSLMILDLGCGTGRNMMKLLQADWREASQVSEVHGWDGSAAMLDVARSKCSAAAAAIGRNVKPADFQQMNFSDPGAVPQEHHSAFTGVVSTLVLEHLPLSPFFTTIATVLAPGGYALVTNMHPDMGRTTKAGYRTASGERVKGESYIHGVDESVAAAREAGLEVLGEIGERAVEAGMIEAEDVGERGKKWVGTKVWYGFVMRKTDADETGERHG